MEATIVLFDKKISGPLEDFINKTTSKVQAKGFSHFKVCTDSLENIVSFANSLSEIAYDINLNLFEQAKNDLKDFLHKILIDDLEEKCSAFAKNPIASAESFQDYVKVINIIKN
jgi:hypothetical protein